MSLPVKLVKLTSDETGPFTPTGVKVANFHIPQSLGFVDLDSAYVLLKMSADTTTNSTETTAVRQVAIGLGSDKPKYDPDVFIRNSYLESERAGRLEDHNDCNIINQVLHFGDRSGEDLQSMTAYDGTFEVDEYGIYRSNFRDLRFLDSSSDSFSNYSLTNGVDGRAPNLTPEIRVPLKSVCKMADGMKQFPLAAVGDMVLHLEFEDDTYTLLRQHDPNLEYECRGFDVSSTDARNSAVLTDHYVNPKSIGLFGGMPIHITGGYDTSGDIVSAEMYTIPADFTATAGTYEISGAHLTETTGTGAQFTLTVTDTSYSTPDLALTIDAGGAGYHSDTVIQVNGANWGAAADVSLFIQTYEVGTIDTGIDVNTYITGLTHNYNGEPGAIRVTWFDAIDACAGDYKANNVVLSQVANDGTPTWSISDANLVLPQLQLNKAQIEAFNKNLKKGIEMNYMVWDSEVVNQDAANRYDRQFRLPPMCANVIGVTPRGSLFSDRDNVDKFRFKINGTITTDRDIEDKTPLYYDRVMETWNNMGRDLKCLDVQRRLDTNTAYANNEPFIYPQPIPLMPQESQLDLNVRSSTQTAGNLYMFKQKQRTLKLNENGAQVIN